MKQSKNGDYSAPGPVGVYGPTPSQWQPMGMQQPSGMMGGGQPVAAAPGGQYPGAMLDVYYANVAIVARTPKDISILFGRVLTLPPQSESQPQQTEARVAFAKQIYMTVQQAAELAELLRKTVEAFQAASSSET